MAITLSSATSIIFAQKLGQFGLKTTNTFSRLNIYSLSQTTYSMFTIRSSRPFYWIRDSYIIRLIVAGGDGRVPLGRALRPIDLEPEPEQDGRGCDEDVLAVLKFGPLSHASLAGDGSEKSGNSRVPLLEKFASISKVILKEGWAFIRAQCFKPRSIDVRAYRCDVTCVWLAQWWSIDVTSQVYGLPNDGL